ncbi:hypothetical protein VT69_09905 [Yersinia pestis]|nr:hypothetical protein VT69_09905 [Yersinia pestis]
MNICSCQTANCFNKSKGVFITDPKLKALLNPQPSWGFSGHKKASTRAGLKYWKQCEQCRAFLTKAKDCLPCSESHQNDNTYQYQL